MIDGIPVIDGVVHAYNWMESNFVNKHAAMITRDVEHAVYGLAMPGYRLNKQGFHRDWTIEEIANLCFLESYNDLAVHHVLPIRSFKDGLCSLEKTREAIERWPDRFIVYAGVDPLEGSKAFDDMEAQNELLKNPVGLKLYPNSWVGQEIRGWHMNDPEVAFPIFERAEKLGFKIIAIHKAVPLGPVAMDHYRMDDIDRAAMTFPNLQFEVIHGGMAFLEETAWQLARFPNVWVNLEITSSLVASRPGTFRHALATMLMAQPALDRIFWGTGAAAFHTRPLIEAFVRSFSFDKKLVEEEGVPELTIEVKRKILSENYARMAGIDLSKALARIKNDSFEQRRAKGLRAPYSTTSAAGLCE